MMSYKRYINFSLKGIMMSSLAVGSFLQTDEKVAKAEYEEGETPTFEEDGIIYITPEATKEAGQKIFSDPNWITGLDNHATQQEVQQIQKLSASQYKDYDGNAYWAKDMKWAIDQGLITGYQNQKHPSQPTKGVGNWLDPYGNLSEYQMLNVMLRYKDGANYEFAKTTMKANTASNFAYVEYFFANQNGMMTKGSMANASFAKQQVTRGQMAQTLVSMHYGKPVTLQQAIDFMYANGITTGVNPSKGQKFENFNVNGKLVRAHIVSFVGRYNDLMDSGNIKDTLNVSTDSSIPNPAPPIFDHTKYDYTKMYGKFDTSKKFTKNNIRVSYQNHTYNVKNQAEYDAVMNHVIKIISGKTLYDALQFPESNKQFDPDHAGQLIDNAKLLERVMQGETFTVINDRTHPSFRSKENFMAMTANTMMNSYADPFSNGVSFDTLTKFDAAFMYIFAFTGGASTAWGPPESAYDFFIKGEIDCTSSAYAEQALYDALGYNTAVVHSPNANHDFIIVELEGRWYTIASGVLKNFTKNSVFKGDFIKFAPSQHADKLSFIKII